MSFLPPNARAEDIELEIMFQQTLLESLDQDADNYVDERQRLEAVLRELETRLEAFTDNGHMQGGDESQPNTLGDSSQELVSVHANLGTSLISFYCLNAGLLA